MDSRAAMISSCWIAIAIISAMFIYVGGVNLGTYVAVGLLVVLAFFVTFGVGFGLEGMRRYGPPSKTQIELSSNLSEMKATLSELANKVEAIQKELEE